jgi:hypothetical protein
MQRKFPLQTHLLVINCALLLVLIILILALSCTKRTIQNNNAWEPGQAPTSPNSTLSFSYGQPFPEYTFTGANVASSGTFGLFASDGSGASVQLNFPFDNIRNDTMTCIGSATYMTRGFAIECDNVNFTVIFQDSLIYGIYSGSDWNSNGTPFSKTPGYGYFTNIIIQ